jgi:hypothetical protein
MSANMALSQQLHFKDQMKLMRAETAASWFATAVAWIVDAATQPLSPKFDVGAAPRSPAFPAFYC